jgi:hypothetical protein
MAEENMIEFGPMTWIRALPYLLLIFTDGSTAGRLYAQQELERMAHLADLYAEEARRIEAEVEDGDAE